MDRNIHRVSLIALQESLSVVPRAELGDVPTGHSNASSK